MEAIGDHRCARGVGVAYHPFLHDYLLEHIALFDFIELPLDLYLDSARAALLDPGQRRLRQVAATGRCVWRGGALRLAAVEQPDEARFAPDRVRRIHDLLQTVSATHYTETISFRIARSGADYAIPFTPAAARWLAERQATATAALGVPVQLCLPDKAIPAPATALDIADFLTLIASAGGKGFVLDAGEPSLTDAIVACLPAGQVTAISVSSDDAATWDAASRLVKTIQPDSIILRRDRQLFPLDTIQRDLRRAAQLIASTAARPVAVAEAAPSMGSDAAYHAGLAVLHEYQLATASMRPDEQIAASQAWRNWRTQVDDMHKAQQIMALTMRGDVRSTLPRPV